MHYLVLCRKNKMLIYHGKKSVLCAELQNAAAKLSIVSFKTEIPTGRKYPLFWEITSLLKYINAFTSFKSS